MKRILLPLLVLISLIVFNPAIAADKKSDKECCETVCSSCAKTCESALKYCLKKGGKHADKAHIATLKDCITLCKASTDLGSRKSALLAKLRAVCSEACSKCAESCDKLNDAQLKACVKTCQDCAKSCLDGNSCCEPEEKKK